eukprot:Phypoly_transcript_13608.p1 GENE.Phypoly_transcript_13608~~Phypoly_transcript_13608.p1  ORF type:complete len:242 (+),score=37.66 Phypoly_transcript_13608:86-811(+)
MAHQGKFYIITGGSSGIGEATSLYLAQQGAHVGILDLQPSGSATSSNFLFEACDVSNAEAVKSAVDKLLSTSGKELAGVVNCAGINKPCPKLHEVTDEFYAKTMDINLKGTFHVMRATIPHIKNGGSIVNTTSTAGLEGMANSSIYCASKHAVIGLTKAAAREYADKLRINAVAPGPIDTPLLWGLSGNDKSNFEKKVLEKTPIGRVIHPLEVAKIIAFLLSEDSSAVTGSVYSVDGGWMA